MDSLALENMAIGAGADSICISREMDPVIQLERCLSVSMMFVSLGELVLRSGMIL